MRTEVEGIRRLVVCAVSYRFAQADKHNVVFRCKRHLEYKVLLVVVGRDGSKIVSVVVRVCARPAQDAVRDVEEGAVTLEAGILHDPLEVVGEVAFHHLALVGDSILVRIQRSAASDIARIRSAIRIAVRRWDAWVPDHHVVEIVGRADAAEEEERIRVGERRHYFVDVHEAREDVPLKHPVKLLVELEGDSFSDFFNSHSVRSIGVHTVDLKTSKCGVETNGPIDRGRIHPKNYGLLRLMVSRVSVRWAYAEPNDVVLAGEGHLEGEVAPVVVGED